MPLASRRSRRSSIFILLVFTAGQFFLSDALSGRDKALKELQQQVSELSDLLALQKSANATLEANAASLSTQLSATLAERDQLTTRIAELAARAKDEAARAEQLSGQLRDADTVVAADKDKIELQLKELESLRRDIEALKSVRAGLESRVAALAAAQQQSDRQAGALRDRSKELE